MKEIIKNGLDRLNIESSDILADRLTLYSKLLKEWNEKINLTAITDDSEIAVKHFIDSLSILTTGKVNGRIIDVGTGAGFPGMVLKAYNPDLDITLLDSLNKRLLFLQTVAEQLNINNELTIIHSRAEDGARKPELREAFDTVTARAVAKLPLLCELCLPYVKVGGYFLAMKGPAADDEIDSAKRAISILGGEIESIKDIEIAEGELTRRIIVIKKVRHTPVKFPRKPSMITKSPIETCYKNSKNHTI